MDNYTKHEMTALLDVFWHVECPVNQLLTEYDLAPDTESYLFSQHLHCPLCRNYAVTQQLGTFETLEGDKPGTSEFEEAMRYVREVEVPNLRTRLQSGFARSILHSDNEKGR